MHVTILGAGFVGVTTAIALAEAGHHVALVEVDSRRREPLLSGRLAFYETGAEEAFAEQLHAGRIAVMKDAASTPDAEVLLICVGTPPGPDGRADVSYIERACQDVALRMTRNRGYAVAAIKSTVPPGTTAAHLGRALDAKGLLDGRCGVGMVPEFLREGSALRDARRPDRVVIGATDAQATDVLQRLLAPEGVPVVRTDLATAELIKYVNNAFLATKIAFANEVANLSERIGIDVDRVMDGVGLDGRIGRAFLNAGCGFGGSCFPKDLAALRATADQHDVPMTILDAVLANNETQPLRVVRSLEAKVGDLRGKTVALLGLAFKPGTSDVRETRALPIWDALTAAGAHVRCHDPHAALEFVELTAGKAEIVETVEEALHAADACVVQAEWPAYREITASLFVSIMRRPLVIDPRRHLDRAALLAGGVDVVALGVGTPAAPNAPMQEILQ